jgi:hypothetical protein
MEENSEKVEDSWKKVPMEENSEKVEDSEKRLKWKRFQRNGRLLYGKNEGRILREG